MTQEFDPKTSYLAVKAHEKMIAYVGFGIRFEAQGQSKEGVIKISSFHRPYRIMLIHTDPAITVNCPSKFQNQKRRAHDAKS